MIGGVFCHLENKQRLDCKQEHQVGDVSMETVPAGASAQASSDQEPSHQGASGWEPSQEEASCLEGACRGAGRACASYGGPGSWEACPGQRKTIMILLFVILRLICLKPAQNQT